MHKDYRNALLYAVSPKADKDFYNTLVKTMLKAKPEVQTDIINFLASEADASAEKREMVRTSEAKWDNPTLGILHNFVKNSGNFDIVEASVGALRNIGDTSSIPVIASLLTKTGISHSHNLPLLQQLSSVWPLPHFRCDWSSPPPQSMVDHNRIILCRFLI